MLANIVFNDGFGQPNDNENKPPFGLLPAINLIPQFRATHPDGRPTGFSDAICNFNSHVILMKGITWSRDSHGLFDYESRHLTKKSLRTDEAVMIMRTNNELRTVPYNINLEFNKQVQAAQADEEDRCLLKIVNHHDSTFYLESAALSQDQTLKMDVVP